MALFVGQTVHVEELELAFARQLDLKEGYHVRIRHKGTGQGVMRNLTAAYRALRIKGMRTIRDFMDAFERAYGDQGYTCTIDTRENTDLAHNTHLESLRRP